MVQAFSTFSALTGPQSSETYGAALVLGQHPLPQHRGGLLALLHRTGLTLALRLVTRPQLFVRTYRT